MLHNTWYILGVPNNVWSFQYFQYYITENIFLVIWHYTAPITTLKWMKLYLSCAGINLKENIVCRELLSGNTIVYMLHFLCGKERRRNIEKHKRKVGFVIMKIEQAWRDIRTRRINFSIITKMSKKELMKNYQEPINNI